MLCITNQKIQAIYNNIYMEILHQMETIISVPGAIAPGQYIIVVMR